MSFSWTPPEGSDAPVPQRQQCPVLTWKVEVAQTRAEKTDRFTWWQQKYPNLYSSLGSGDVLRRLGEMPEKDG